MRQIIQILFFLILISCNSKKDRSKAFVPESSGNLNYVTIVMNKSDWDSSLGNIVRKSMGAIYAVSYTHLTLPTILLV